MFGKFVTKIFRMIKTKVSAVSYVNSYPFVYGLQQKEIARFIKLSLDNPADCSYKLLKNQADIGLVPVVTLLDLDFYKILSEYCIGAVNNVQTVMLYSHSSLEQIDTVYLDGQSRSSNMLCRVLSKNYWKKEIQFIFNTSDELPDLKPKEAAILIGDRVFQTKRGYTYKYDLSKEWNDFTGLPFVFAVWTANKELNPDFQKRFELAIEYGINHMDEAIETLAKEEQKDILKDYYTKNISYIFDKEKEKGMNLFLELAKNI